jgi:tetrahydromethanopterin S-methyltransferase subunit F
MEPGLIAAAFGGLIIGIISGVVLMEALHDIEKID